MPSRNPFYELPPFPPTGDEKVDASLAAWRQNAGGLITRDLFELERLPATFTAATTNVGAFAATPAFSSYLSQSVGLQGNEKMLAFASVQMATTGASANYTIQVTYPNGDQVLLSSMTATLDTTGVTVVATITGHWTIPTKIQTGGKHTLDVMLSASTAGLTTATQAREGVLTIFLL